MLVDVEIYSLNLTAMFCNQRPKLLAKFVFKMSTFTFHFNTCASCATA